VRSGNRSVFRGGAVRRSGRPAPGPGRRYCVRPSPLPVGRTRRAGNREWHQPALSRKSVGVGRGDSKGWGVLARLPVRPDTAPRDRRAAGHLRPARRLSRRAQALVPRHGHQRCRVHFARNLLAHVPKTHTDVFRRRVPHDRRLNPTPPPSPRPGTRCATSQVSASRKSAHSWMRPRRPCWRSPRSADRTGPKVRSTNPLKRVDKEIKRRARVVGIFPNEAAVIRLVAMPLKLRGGDFDGSGPVVEDLVVLSAFDGLVAGTVAFDHSWGFLRPEVPVGGWNNKMPGHPRHVVGGCPARCTERRAPSIHHHAVPDSSPRVSPLPSARASRTRLSGDADMKVHARPPARSSRPAPRWRGTRTRLEGVARRV
jgi:hypothetical protein